MIKYDMNGRIFNVAPEIVARFLDEVGMPVLNEADRVARLAGRVDLMVRELATARLELSKSFSGPDMWKPEEIAKAAKSAVMEGYGILEKDESLMAPGFVVPSIAPVPGMAN